MSSPVTDAFLACLPEPARIGDPAGPLAAMLAAARQRWPELSVSEATFGAHLGARVAAEADPAAALAGLRGEDLYLVCACLAGDARALRALEAGPLRGVRDRLQRAGLAPEVVADACQRVASSLLIASDGHPARLASYAGRGDLAGCLYVAVARNASR